MHTEIGIAEHDQNNAATVMPGPKTITNAAHNVVIDSLHTVGSRF
jgi:hypothetical protein